MLLHMDGFDEYNTLADMQMEYFTLNGVILPTGGRYGGGAYQAVNDEAGVARALPTNPTDVWMGVAVNPTTGHNANSTFQLFNFIGNNGSCVFITYNYTTSLFQIWRSAGSGSPVLIGFEAALFVPGAWHWIEARCKLDGVDGIVELWLDNVRQVNLTGVSTNPNSSTSITTAVLTTIAAPGTSIPFIGIYDDWYILDTSGAVNNTRLGDSRIETRIPISDAGPNDGTPSSGSTHFNLLNAVPWSTANTVTLTNADGQEELFNMSPLVSNPLTIFACRALTIMEKTDGGTMTGRTVTVSGGTEADGPITPGLNIWCHIDGIQELDPHTSAAWTATTVNASKVGFKIST